MYAFGKTLNMLQEQDLHWQPNTAGQQQESADDWQMVSAKAT